MMNASAKTYSGDCGDNGSNVKWTLDTSTGEMKITGSGKIMAYSSPGYKYKTSIKKVIIGKGVTSIGDDAFYGYTNLTSVSIPSSVTRIERSAFEGCTSLTSVSIPNSVTYIDNAAFYGCTSLTSVTIPKSVEFIEYNAFSYCKKLSSITVDSENKYFCNDKYGALLDKKKTMLIQYPVGNTRTSYTIPDTVTSIVTEAFSSSKYLTSVSIPSSVTYIGDSAFSHCTSLKNVTIPDGVTYIAWHAFQGCTGLTSVTIPKSVEEIYSPFVDCEKLSSITVDSENKNYSSDKYSVLFNKNKTTLIKYPAGNARTSYTIPDCVTTIDGYAFFRCTSLTSITIPNSVKEIKNYAFYGCNKFENIIIPKSVTYMGSYAFYGCNKFENITIPKSVTYMGSSAFKDCENLTTVKILNPECLVDASEALFDDADKFPSTTKIYGYPNSTAHEYAKKYKRTFRCIESHTYGSWQTTKAATCTDDGTKAKTCSVCGYKSTATIAKLTHNYSTKWTVDKKATCKAAGSKSHHCLNCGAKKDVTSIAKTTTHTYETKITKATLSKNGQKITACSVCGKEKSKSTIYKISSVKLSATSYTYDGNTKTPSVTVKDSNGNTLKKDTDYTVSYSSGRKNIGSYSVTVKFKGNYSGSKTLTFKITFEKPSVSKSVTYKNSKYNIILSWKAVKGATSYRIELMDLTDSSKVYKTYNQKELRFSLPANPQKKDLTVKFRVYAIAKDGTKSAPTTVTCTLPKK